MNTRRKSTVLFTNFISLETVKKISQIRSNRMALPGPLVWSVVNPNDLVQKYELDLDHELEVEESEVVNEDIYPELHQYDDDGEEIWMQKLDLALISMGGSA